MDTSAVVRTLLDLQEERSSAVDGWRLPFRSDHGHIMMDDLDKIESLVPGYPAIGRMRGLAELRGLMLGLQYAKAHGK